MGLLGKGEEITADGRLIVQCSDTPEIGEFVYDGKQNKIGIVKRVFGPVDAPYASVTTNTDAERFRGKELYTKDGVKQHGKDKRRGRRNRSLS